MAPRSITCASTRGLSLALVHIGEGCRFPLHSFASFMLLIFNNLHGISQTKSTMHMHVTFSHFAMLIHNANAASCNGFALN